MHSVPQMLDVRSGILGKGLSTATARERVGGGTPISKPARDVESSTGADLLYVVGESMSTDLFSTR